MRRDEMISRVEDHQEAWDVIVIGGGATGVGTALDAASRGYDVLLLEQADFSQGTSSRSTKLAHGGVRYLQQGNISLVLDALEERGVLLENAPHLVKNQQFVVPNYDWWQGPFYGIGLKLYDALAGKKGFGKSKLISKEETLEYIPTIETRDLRGGVIYHDGQFDDSRLVIDMVKTANEQGATVLNYCKVTRLIKESGFIRGVVVEDHIQKKEYELKCKVVVNATGVFSDTIRLLDEPEEPGIIQPSQGVHIVLDKSFLPGDTAIMVPHTDDGRVLFAIPWHDKVIVGTTDTPVTTPELEPVPFQEEITFLLNHAAKYLSKDPSAVDVLSVFAGLRPLVKAKEGVHTAALSRDHTLSISNSGLVTITGGKWTTYRKMAEDTVNQVAILGQLESRECITKSLRIHGYHKNSEIFGRLSSYGADAQRIKDLIRSDDPNHKSLHPAFEVQRGEVIWAVREEMAQTVEDFLSRRTRSLLLDAQSSVEIAPEVAKIMAKELGKKKSWIKNQVEAYGELAKKYILSGAS